MRALCLSLPEQPERGERAMRHFQECGLGVEMVCAVNGGLTGLASTHPYEHDHPGTDYVIGPATIGIFLSHYIIWSIVAHGQDEFVLVLEDDVILGSDFKSKMNQALLDVPEDWDMLFLGSCCTAGHPMTHTRGTVYKIYPQCLHAYIMTRKAARALLPKYRDVYGPIDCLLRLNNYSGLNVYTVLPRIAEQMNTELPP